jgi:hypothetical protein
MLIGGRSLLRPPHEYPKGKAKKAVNQVRIFFSCGYMSRCVAVQVVEARDPLPVCQYTDRQWAEDSIPPEFRARNCPQYPFTANLIASHQFRVRHGPVRWRDLAIHANLSPKLPFRQRTKLIFKQSCNVLLACRGSYLQIGHFAAVCRSGGPGGEQGGSGHASSMMPYAAEERGRPVFFINAAMHAESAAGSANQSPRGARR